MMKVPVSRIVSFAAMLAGPIEAALKAKGPELLEDHRK